jgi:hypothetical protein
MLDQKGIDEFYDYMRAQGLEQSDVDWLVKRCGIDGVHRLAEREAGKLRHFAANRRKLGGRTLFEQWDGWKHNF